MNKFASVFIPHKGNQYRPHAIRHQGLLVFAAFILLFQGIYNHQATGTFQVLGYATNVNTSDLLSSTNAQRSANGLSGFSVSSKLSQAAQAKANHMIANDYWAHYAPDGTSPWYFIEQAGYSYQRAGENLAFGFSTSSGVITGWMNSPTHRANVLDAGFTQVGFGIANGSDFQGGENTVIVAMYGQPVVATTPKPKASAPKTVAAASVEEPEAVAQPISQPKEIKEEVKADETPKPVEVVEEKTEEVVATEDSNSQRLLARLAEDGEIIVTGYNEQEPGTTDHTITNIEAMVTGQAHWSLYMVMGGMLAMSMIFFLRHLQAVYQILVHGEHYVTGHPTLEASIVYLAIWILMFASYGAIQ
jgi:uncharacterized protein YkwD